MDRQWAPLCKHALGGGLVLLVLYRLSLYSYVLFHSFVELFSGQALKGSRG